MPKGLAGFTLLELLSVVIIIAVLTTAAIPEYMKAVERSRAAEALTLLGAIRVSEQRYKAQSPGDTYTAAFSELDIQFPVGGTQSWGAETPAGGNPPNPPENFSLTTSRARLTRKGGTYNDQVLGMIFDTGALCGDFVPLSVSVGCP